MSIRKRKNGFILLLVIAMIPLIGMVVAIMTANSKALSVQTRSAELRLRAENTCQSGLGWVRQNPAKAAGLTPENPLTLTLKESGDRYNPSTSSGQALPDGRTYQSPFSSKIYCLIERTPQETFQITGYAEEGRHSVTCRRLLMIDD